MNKPLVAKHSFLDIVSAIIQDSHYVDQFCEFGHVLRMCRMITICNSYSSYY